MSMDRETMKKMLKFIYNECDGGSGGWTENIIILFYFQ